MVSDISELEDDVKGLDQLINEHNRAFEKNYPNISREMKEGSLIHKTSIAKLLINELFFIKFLRK